MDYLIVDQHDRGCILRNLTFNMKLYLTNIMCICTLATNTVLKTFPMTADDAILVTNWTYYAAYMTACVAADMSKGRILHTKYGGIM